MIPVICIRNMSSTTNSVNPGNLPEVSANVPQLYNNRKYGGLLNTNVPLQDKRKKGTIITALLGNKECW